MTDPELPPESRITSRVEGDTLIITVPGSRSPKKRWFIGSRGSLAVFAFLTITFIAQGGFTHTPSWTAGGFLFLLLTVFQLPFLFRYQHKIVYEITSQDLTEITGLAATPLRRNWPRDGFGDHRMEDSIFGLKGLADEEVEWILEQIRRKWEAPK